MPREEPLIPKHGGYRKLKSFQVARLAYDVTVRFCDLYISRRSRTHDQMVQAGRSGVQNIAEGSVDSATSKKIELKLTGVAKGSLEELRLDYEDFLRQRGLPQWSPEHPALQRFKALRCATLAEFRTWVADEVLRDEKNTDKHGEDTDGHGLTQTEKSPSHPRPCPSVSVRVPPPVRVLPKDLPAVLAANGALSLLNLCIYLLDRQMETQARSFEEEGGFTERLYRVRSARRGESNSARKQ